MDHWDRAKSRARLDKNIRKIKPLFDFMKHVQSTKGWIQTSRETLGMSLSQLGHRAKLSQPRLSRLEKAEIAGDLKVSSLQKMAEALDMEFVYAFVPRDSFEKMVQKQARKTAQKRMTRLNQTMRLEQQEMTKADQQKMLADLTQKILMNETKHLWDV